MDYKPAVSKRLREYGRDNILCPKDAVLASPCLHPDDVEYWRYKSAMRIDPEEEFSGISVIPL